MKLIENPIFKIKPQTLLRFTAPANEELADAGIRDVQRFIRNHSKDFGFRHTPADWDWKWLITKTEDSSFSIAGTLPKRFAKYSYKQHKQKVNSRLIQKLGDIARPHVQEGREFIYDITFDIDWNDGEFGDGGSCYWGENKGAVPMMLDHGFGAVRFYRDEPSYQYSPHEDVRGIGRCWLGKYHWTLNRNNDYEIAVVFNAYDEAFSLVTIARFLSTLTGQAYRKIELRNQNQYRGLLWINSGKGYAIAPVEVLEEIERIDFTMNESSYSSDYCRWCECDIRDGYEFHTPSGEIICETCWDDNFFHCDRCGNDGPSDLSYYIDDTWTWCEDCMHDYAFLCDYCEEWKSNDHSCIGNRAFDHNGELDHLCEWCAERQFSYCDRCEYWFYREYKPVFYTTTGDHSCEDCLTEEEVQMEMNL